MKKRTLYLFGLAATGIILTSSSPADPMSFGAPASSTGAPGEQTCQVQGCHSDIPINSGKAQVELTIKGNPTDYEPGKTYTFVVNINDAGMQRCGFQAVALANNNHSNAGEIIITEPTRTQVLQNDMELLDRNYVTYTYPGTEAVTTGKGQWTFDWKAPETNQGTISFYLGAISANDDGTDKGDHTYTTSIQLQPSLLFSINNTLRTENFVTYNPDNKMLKGAFNAGISEITLYTISGTKVLSSKQIQNNQMEVSTSSLAPGTYFLVINKDQSVITEKVIIY